MKIKNQKFKNTFKSKIKEYGFEYSVPRYTGFILIALGIVFLAGYFYQLQPIYILILAIVAAVSMPFIILAQYSFIYSHQQFTQLISYMDGMIYSFLLHPKIIDALEVVKQTADEKMSDTIDLAIRDLEAGESYETALNHIEKEYSCARIHSLHYFLCKVENSGGSYRSLLTSFQDDVSAWTERTYGYQIDQKHKKMEIYMSIIICLLMCGFLLYLQSKFKDINFTDVQLYQILTTGLLIFFVITFVILETKLNGSWLEDDRNREKALFKRYIKYNHFDKKAEIKKSLMKSLILIPALVISLYYSNLTNASLILFASIVLIYLPFHDHRKAKKEISEGIEKSFPDWLRDLVMEIQFSNVRVALEESYKDAPLLIKPSLKNLIKDIDENPVDIWPYQKFLNDYDLPVLKRTMKTIYTLNTLGTEDVEAQLGTIIRQNDKLSEKAEMYKFQESIAGIGALSYLPQAITSLKLMVDMFLLFLALMQSLGGIF